MAKEKGITMAKKPYAPELNISPSQQMRLNKLKEKPKTSPDSLFTVPKGAQGLNQQETDAMQRRRILDRQRTIARATGLAVRSKLPKR